MAPGAPTCDWTSDPGDKIALVTYFASIKDKIGQGGSWDQTALESAATHMATRGPPIGRNRPGVTLRVMEFPLHSDLTYLTTLYDLVCFPTYFPLRGHLLTYSGIMTDMTAYDHTGSYILDHYNDSLKEAYTAKVPTCGHQHLVASGQSAAFQPTLPMDPGCTQVGWSLAVVGGG
ncbi:hypothetical protein B0H10DRAFT_1940626 [Mycena sp. CBHHK59/15]|nr:hypothetical protein B0H10DRAFT_1940626 [Mycena sp. CBHHK59/15]